MSHNILLKLIYKSGHIQMTHQYFYNKIHNYVKGQKLHNLNTNLDHLLPLTTKFTIVRSGKSYSTKKTFP